MFNAAHAQTLSGVCDDQEWLTVAQCQPEKARHARRQPTIVPIPSVVLDPMMDKIAGESNYQLRQSYSHCPDLWSLYLYFLVGPTLWLMLRSEGPAVP